MHAIEVNKEPFLYLNKKEFKELLKSGTTWNPNQKSFYGVTLNLFNELDFIISRDDERDFKGIAIKKNNELITYKIGEQLNG